MVKLKLERPIDISLHMKGNENRTKKQFNKTSSDVRFEAQFHLDLCFSENVIRCEAKKV